MNCYRVRLETANAARDTANANGQYVHVRDGYLYVLSPNIAEVAVYFENALEIALVGPGFRLDPPEEHDDE